MVVTVKTGEAVLACLTQITILLALSPATVTLDSTRTLCATIGQALVAEIGAAKKLIAEHGLPDVILYVDPGPGAETLHSILHHQRSMKL